MAARGHDVRVVTADVGAVQGYYEFGVKRVGPPLEVLNGVVVKRLPYCDVLYSIASRLYRSEYSGIVGRKLAWRMARYFREKFHRAVETQILDYQPDVVMTMPHLVTNVAAVVSAKIKCTFPLVIVPMLHESDPNWNVPAMARALKSADAVVAMTKYEIRRLVEAYEVPRDKIMLGSVGVDIPSSVDWKERPPRVVYLGRKARSKGINVLIDAMRQVWNVIPEAELWLAGVRLPETVEIDRQVAALPDEQRTRVKDFGTVHGRAKNELLQSARCLVLPSRIESFGMVLLDAWANGTPVVVWDRPLFRDIVQDGVDGLLASPDGPMGLADAIRPLLEDGPLAMSMGRSGYEKVRSRYSWNKVTNAYLDAYQGII